MLAIAISTSVCFHHLVLGLKTLDTLLVLGLERVHWQGGTGDLVHPSPGTTCLARSLNPDATKKLKRENPDDLI